MLSKVLREKQKEPFGYPRLIFLSICITKNFTERNREFSVTHHLFQIKQSQNLVLYVECSDFFICCSYFKIKKDGKIHQNQSFDDRSGQMNTFHVRTMQWIYNKVQHESKR